MNKPSASRWVSYQESLQDQTTWSGRRQDDQAAENFATATCPEISSSLMMATDGFMSPTLGTLGPSNCWAETGAAGGTS